MQSDCSSFHLIAAVSGKFLVSSEEHRGLLWILPGGRSRRGLCRPTGSATGEALVFWHGRRLCQVAPAYHGEDFIGLCDGRVVATAPDRAGVVRALILAARWRR